MQKLKKIEKHCRYTTLEISWWYTSVSNNNPVSHDSVTLSQDVQFQDPETEADKWNASIIQFIFLYL